MKLTLQRIATVAWICLMLFWIVYFTYGSSQRHLNAERDIQQNYGYEQVSADFWGTGVSWTSDGGTKRCDGDYSTSGRLIYYYCRDIILPPPK